MCPFDALPIRTRATRKEIEREFRLAREFMGVYVKLRDYISQRSFRNNWVQVHWKCLDTFEEALVPLARDII